MQPESLSVEDGTKVARSCQEIFLQSGIIDIDIEIRESLVTLLEGPKLLMPTFSSDPTVDVRNPLTPTFGLPSPASSHLALRVQAAFLLPKVAAVRGSPSSQLGMLSLS